jgi:hypothetical protein
MLESNTALAMGRHNPYPKISFAQATWGKRSNKAAKRTKIIEKFGFFKATS